MKRLLGVFWILMAVCPEVVAREVIMDKLIEQLKRHEGVKHFPYRDSVGVLTIGCGRNISTSKKHKGLGLSIAEIDFLLKNDIVRTIQELSKEYPWFNDLEDGARRDGIINLHFNLGRLRYASFRRANSHMSLGEHDSAAVEFLDSKWAKQVKKTRALEITDQIRTNTYAG